jgi:serine protease
MKKNLLALVALCLFLWSCERQLSDSSDTKDGAIDVLVFRDKKIEKIEDLQPIPKPKLDQMILEELKAKDDFRWAWADDLMFWSATKASEPQVAIGYKPVRFGDINETIHKININDREWKQVHDELLDFIVKELNAQNPKSEMSVEDILVEDDAQLPRIVVNLDNYEVIAKLRACENIRYIEPLDFDLTQEEDGRSNSGCGGAAVSSLPAGDYTFTTPNNCVVPWNYAASSNIPAAWNLASTPQDLNGKNITIGLIDAGISSTQPLLNANFASGNSWSGRTRTVGATLGTSGYTSCTHGTSMCGLAAGPRNNVGSTVGVAYNANLKFVRAAEDVVLDKASEKTAVKNAFVQLGNDPTVKIISMSMGTPIYSGTLEDGVNYAYNQGKMIFCAAGTSLSWTSWYGVIYPAKHSVCIAMTGVKENGNRCTVCHDGSEVDFTMLMERNANSDRTSLAYHASGNLPSYVGGSSCATAMGAGVAAMVWSVNPAFTRAQVYNYLKNTAQYSTPTNGKGYGRLNALSAVDAALNN